MASQEKDENYNYQEGPIKERSCTDIFCCILFIIFTGFCCFVAFFAISNGDPAILAKPYDPDYTACGEGKNADYPYIYFANPSDTASILQNTVCVKSCPDSPTATVDCSTNSVVDSCEAQLMMLEVYETKPLYGSLCFPATSKDGENATTADARIKALKTALSFDQLELIISDLNKSYFVIIGAVFITLIVSYLFLYLIRGFAGIVIWIFIITILLLFILFGGLLFGNWYLHTQTDGEGALQKYANDPQYQEYINKLRFDNKSLDPSYYLYGAIACWVFALILLIVVLVFWSTIRIGIAIIKASARFLQENICIVFLPILFFFFTIIYFFYWTTVTVYLFSCGTVHKDGETNPRPFGNFDYSDTVEYYGLFHLFALFWNIQFIGACCTFIIISATSIWFFNQMNKTSVIGTSFYNLFRYHLGSVAFGSLLIAIVQFMRAILEYINQQTKGSQSQIMKTVIQCCRCCLWVFEKVLKFLCKAAYVVIAVKSKSFLSAGKDAIYLILNNPGRIAMVNAFSFVFEYLGNVCIAAITSAICYLIIDNMDRYNTLNSPWPTTFACFILAYTIASFFMGIYSTSADSMILIFCIDEEMASKFKGTTMHPAELNDFFEQSDEHEKQQGREVVKNK